MTKGAVSGGTKGGRRAVARWLADIALDVESFPRRRRLDDAARTRPPRRRVLVVGVERPGSLMPAMGAELKRTRHDLTLRTVMLNPKEGGTARGKFELLNDLLAENPVTGYDWLFAVDDDVVLPGGFVDRFLLAAEDASLKLAQPAHRLHSHATWPVTRRRPLGSVRQTRCVEIGPITAFRNEAFQVLLPFPDLRMGWGLDLHWGAVARERGWRAGIVDATPVMHVNPIGRGYDHAAAAAEAESFLANRPYISDPAEQQWWHRVS